MAEEIRKEFDPTMCQWHTDDIHNHKNALFGNGSVGLIKDVSSIKTYVKLILALLITLLGGVAGMIFHVAK